MDALKPKDVCELVEADDAEKFRKIVDDTVSGITLIPDDHQNTKRISSDAGDFAKWVRERYDTLVCVQAAERKMLLRSGDVFLPLAFLATDISLPIYLNMVSSYLYDLAKGALKGDKQRVRLSVEFEDKNAGIVKRFNFEGDAEDLRKVAKRIDVNELMNG